MKGLLAGTLATAAAIAILPVASAATTQHVSTLCRRDQLFRVENYIHQTADIRNDEFGTGDICLRVYGRQWSRFRISSTRTVAGQALGAFPEIFYGCVYGKCSTGTDLPTLVTNDQLALTWQTYPTRPKGLWNKAFDIWFSKRKHVGGQASGAELMIWLDTTFPTPSADRAVVDIAGVRYWYATHRACNRVKGLCWNYVLFRRVHAVAGVKGLHLAPFVTYAERHGMISRHWWLSSVEAGFELWSGGVHLGTKRFAVRRLSNGG